VPSPTIGPVVAALARLGGAVRSQASRGGLSTVDAVLAAARAPDLQRQLAGLARGEGVLELTVDGYQAVRGRPPRRRRTTPNPLHREEYLAALTRGRDSVIAE